MQIEVGTSATIQLVVADPDTAIALRSGDVPVLGTPRIVALMEQAAVATLAGTLDEGATSVGTRISVEHLAASLVGVTVTATAEVVSLEGRAVSFRLTLHEGDRQVATGDHVRFVVDRERFLGR
jgi:fluoroacetyl-CoA thioesterase